MPEQIRCPECNATLRVPDTLLGKSVKCPKCQKTFTAELEEPPEEAIEEEPPQRPASARRRPRLEPEDEDEDAPEEPPEEDEDRPRPRRRRGRFSAAAASAVAGPAIALMVAGGLGIVVAILDLIARLAMPSLLAGAAGKDAPPGFVASLQTNLALGSVIDVLGIFWGIILLVGALRMKQLKNYGLAMTTCILGMVPVNCCCLLGLPFGIWGLVALNKPEVKDAFS
jgi:predicted Zn finger-like uncharacterized protein